MDEVTVIVDDLTEAVTINTLTPVTNVTHTGEVTGDVALTIADNIVDEANLKLDEAPTNDFVLTADSTKTGGMKWAAAGGGGGTEYQIYELQQFSIDSNDSTDWMGIDGSITGSAYWNEYDKNLAALYSASATTISGFSLYRTAHAGVANGAQTVEDFVLYSPGNLTANLVQISIFKTKFTAPSTLNYITILYEGAISWSNGYFKVPAVSFAETAIADDDVIYVIFGANSAVDTYHFSYRLKCSID